MKVEHIEDYVDAVEYLNQKLFLPESIDQIYLKQLLTSIKTIKELAGNIVTEYYSETISTVFTDNLDELIEYINE